MALTYYMDFNFSKLECDKGELGMHSKDKIFLPYRLKNWNMFITSQNLTTTIFSVTVKQINFKMPMLPLNY